MRLVDTEQLKDAIMACDLWDSSPHDREIICDVIDNAPTVERQRGECKSCRHRDPEDKKCDCGRLERQGCLFPVSDDYYCKYYEKGGAE